MLAQTLWASTFNLKKLDGSRFLYTVPQGCLVFVAFSNEKYSIIIHDETTLTVATASLKFIENEEDIETIEALEMKYHKRRNT